MKDENLERLDKRIHKKKVKEDRLRTVRALEKEQLRILRAQHNLGVIELEKPLRDGWIKTMKIKDEYMKSKHAKVYSEILDVIADRIWGREIKYADKSWDNRNKRITYYYQRPGIRYIYEKKYKELSAKAKKHFCFLTMSKWRFMGRKYYCTLPKYYFETTYERAYITSRSIISPELQSRYDEIDNRLKSYKLFVYQSLLRKNYQQADCKSKRRASKIELRELLFQ